MQRSGHETPWRVLVHQQQRVGPVVLALLHGLHDGVVPSASGNLRTPRTSFSCYKRLQDARDVEHEHGVASRVVDGVLLRHLQRLVVELDCCCLARLLVSLHETLTD